MSNSQKRPYNHKKCCAKCSIRVDTTKQKNKRRKIKEKWLVDYFKLIEIDTSYYTYCCCNCYFKLLNLNKTNSLVQEALNDKNKINEMFKTKKANFLEAKSSSFNNISSKQIYDLTGITLDDFENLYNSIKDNWNRKINLKNLLLFYLMKLRLGLSTTKVASLFPISSNKTIYKHLNVIRPFLLENFVKFNLGVEHISRNELIKNHTTNISKQLFDIGENKLITVWDGTYVYIEKSSNYSFQKHTYSMHKGRHLLKMMMVVATNGDFFSIFLYNFTKLSKINKLHF
jgi:hypothetical protein